MAPKHKEIQETPKQTFIWKHIDFRHLSEERIDSQNRLAALAW